MTPHEWLSSAVLIIVTVSQGLLTVDRWVHRQGRNDEELDGRVQRLTERLAAAEQRIGERLTTVEHSVDQIIQRASEINSTLQRMVGRLEIGRFRGDGNQ